MGFLDIPSFGGIRSSSWKFGLEEIHVCVQSLCGLGTELGIKRGSFDRLLLSGVQGNRCFARFMRTRRRARFVGLLERGCRREFAARRMIEVDELLLR